MVRSFDIRPVSAQDTTKVFVMVSQIQGDYGDFVLETSAPLETSSVYPSFVQRLVAGSPYDISPFQRITEMEHFISCYKLFTLNPLDYEKVPEEPSLSSFTE